jgi:predicted RNA binding protein YcfA (HicA-like mRNA interferase family)
VDEWREVCTILAQHGFVEVRRRASHIIMQRNDAGNTTSVAVPDRPEIRRGTLQSITRQSDSPRALFEA